MTFYYVCSVGLASFLLIYKFNVEMAFNCYKSWIASLLTLQWFANRPIEQEAAEYFTV